MSTVKYEFKNSKDYLREGFVLPVTVLGAENILSRGIMGETVSFSAMLDTGATSSCVSSVLMGKIKERIFNKDGSVLKAITRTKSRGMKGAYEWCDVYILPQVYIGRLHLKNVVVVEVEDANNSCVIGRFLLQQCNLSMDTKNNKLTLEIRQEELDDSHKKYSLPPFSSVDLNTQEESLKRDKIGTSSVFNKN